MVRNERDAFCWGMWMFTINSCPIEWKVGRKRGVGGWGLEGFFLNARGGSVLPLAELEMLGRNRLGC